MTKRKYLGEEADQTRLPLAYLVGVQSQGMSADEAKDLLAELAELTDTLGLPQAGSCLARLREPNPALLLGSGKAKEIIEEAKNAGADLIIIDEMLSPVQQRNWEELSELAVIDRQEVILDIFAARAQTNEARLQVALAKANYDLPRLTRKWTHLHRQRGMSGGLGGRAEGEQQLELDQRQVRDRIAKLGKQLDEVRKQRQVQRSKRLRKPLPVAAIVGYTNAGKSSLLNQLTAAQLLVENKLFATLDPTLRRLQLPGGLELLLGDTVGFIRKLPHLLVEAFKSTLEETRLADYIIEVLDASSGDNLLEFHQTTQNVLEEIGAGLKPGIIVLNKIDLVPDKLSRQRLLRKFPDAILVSAKTGEGLPQLLESLVQQSSALMREMRLLVPHERYDIMKTIRSQCSINQEKYNEQGVELSLRAPKSCQAILEEFAL
ncbi:MAG: GTPase HflX [Lentisphaeria bacterium]|nr:GTPase HflX [Lentisphaeria bacterium]NLZ59853.1 GTPase HflX [Lentisphaerota bacterium]